MRHTMIRQTLGLRLAIMLRALAAPNVEREEGQTLAEYALILGLIAVAVIGVVTILGTNIGDIFTKISSDLV